MSKTTRYGLATVPAVLLGGMSSAYAAVPTEITDAIDTMQADATTIAGAVLVAIIAVLAFKFLRKAF